MKNDLLREAVVVLVTIVISMTGFWLMIGRTLITRDEASVMITEKTSAIQTEYTSYKLFMEDQLRRSDKQNEDLKMALNQNTNAVNDLKIQIATLAQAMLYIQEQLKEGK